MPEVPRQLAALQRFGHVDLDPTIAHLVEMRASQINGCAFCLDMHWKDARAAGEDEARLYLLDAWRENPEYSDRERAALELTEAVTRLEPGGVPDAIWDAAAAQFSRAELAGLLCKIAAINAWNRLQITTKAEPGHYQPGDFGKAPEPAGAGADAGAVAGSGAGDGGAR
ncbi:MAG: carboxymuconolactone decarboxylase family protein [Actinobacteria bacterium]|nr:carboxymuconolactone decarboxylase family protein [Actinomycetota bacterium]MBS1882474.1 carboxymuconolactone decarboxylase family protein [Actinomycetota bacterium]